MPLQNQTNYQWRPNDNGSITNHRYDIEAEKWINAVGNATSKLPSGNIGGDFQFIGTVLMIPLCFLIFIILVPIQIIKAVVGYNIKLLPGDPPTGWIDRRTNLEKLQDEINALKVKYPPRKKRKTTWEDLTEEQKEMVLFVKSDTAKAKAKMEGI